MKPRSRQCKICKTKFIPFDSFEWWCSSKCGYELSTKLVEAKNRKDTLKAKEQLKTLTDYKREAQTVFNKYIRLRDKDLGCISCGKFDPAKQYHAGHYYTVGGNPERRYDENNCHKQCQTCNTHLSGNIVNYRLGLIKRFSIEFVDDLETYKPPIHLTIDDVKAIKTEYKIKIKRL